MNDKLLWVIVGVVVLGAAVASIKLFTGSPPPAPEEEVVPADEAPSTGPEAAPIAPSPPGAVPVIPPVEGMGDELDDDPDPPPKVIASASEESGAPGTDAFLDPAVGVRVEGKVFDPATLAPIPGAIISVYAKGRPKPVIAVASEATGVYAVAHLKNGEYTISASGKGFLPKSFKVNLFGPKPVPLSFALERL